MSPRWWALVAAASLFGAVYAAVTGVWPALALSALGTAGAVIEARSQ